MALIRQAELPGERDTVRRLWLEYLRWSNEETEARHGFRLPVESIVERDIANTAKYEPPDGHLLLALVGDDAIGVACLRRIGVDTAEIKRMYVQPSHRGAGIGRSLFDRLIELATIDGYGRVRLDSPDFMTAAHALYRSGGFTDIEAYPESEIPDEYRTHWVFLERKLRPEATR